MNIIVKEVAWTVGKRTVKAEIVMSENGKYRGHVRDAANGILLEQTGWVDTAQRAEHDAANIATYHLLKWELDEEDQNG